MARVRVVVPPPDCFTSPVPLITPEYDTALLRLKTRVPLLLTSPAIAPLVPPAPTCKVPALMVVAPA